MTEKSDLEIDQKIETHKEGCTREFVRWQVFLWAMGVVLIVFGWMFYAQGALATKVSSYQDTNTSMREDIASIKTSLEFIKENIKK